MQHYADTWPMGINVLSAQQGYIGADGANSGYGDVEYAWRTTHDDLTSIGLGELVNGAPHSSVNSTTFRNHGTAVAGMLSAADDASG